MGNSHRSESRFTNVISFYTSNVYYTPTQRVKKQKQKESSNDVDLLKIFYTGMSALNLMSSVTTQI